MRLGFRAKGPCKSKFSWVTSPPVQGKKSVSARRSGSTPLDPSATPDEGATRVPAGLCTLSGSQDPGDPIQTPLQPPPLPGADKRGIQAGRLNLGGCYPLPKGRKRGRRRGCTQV